MKSRCEICGILYELIPTKIRGGIEEGAVGMDTSVIRIRLRARTQDPAKSFYYDTCPSCTQKLVMHIKDMQREAPCKCFWCEFDFGPKHPNYRKGCEGCSNYCNFKLKKRMGSRQRDEWKMYYEGEEK